MTNPLLTPFSLPPFSAIRPEDIVPAVQSALADCRAAVERVVAQPGPFTWDNLCQPLAESDDRLSRIWSPMAKARRSTAISWHVAWSNACLPCGNA